MRSRTWLVVAVLALGAPLSAGCAPALGVSATTSGVSADQSVDYAEADVTFSQDMLHHHRQTIEIAELVADRSKDAYVRELGAKLITGERADIEKMESWLRSWKVPVPEDMDSTHVMPGMLSVRQIAVLEGLSGAEFDRAWLTTLSTHLAAGVTMAETVRTLGTHPPTAELADHLITGQHAQITEIAGHLT